MLLLPLAQHPSASTKQAAPAESTPQIQQQQSPAAEAAQEQAEPADAPQRVLVPDNGGATTASRTDAETTASHPVPGAAPTPDPVMDEVNQYLWGVYQRTARKQDNSGDFTWKDVAGAAHLGMTLGDYVIAGMDPDFRELLYRAGLAMDAAGMRWTILSAFRDDYRQGLVAGYKARVGDSLHGGSATTGGYGHGCAVDIADVDGKSVPLWKWIDVNSAQVSLERPMPGFDPAHIQARGPWHAIAVALRSERLAKDQASEDVPADSELIDLSNVAPSDTDMKCVGLHHHRSEPASPPPEAANFNAAHAYVAEKAAEKAPDKTATRSELPHAHAGTRVASEQDKPTARGKTFTRSLSRHALHGMARSAGTT